MRRFKFALVAVALMVASMASAQVSLGIKGGLNMSNFGGGDTKDGYKMKLGYNVGVAADFEFANGFAVQSGLFFTTKGSKITAIEVGENNKIVSNVNLQYLQVPVYLAYKVPVTFDTRVVFHAGPYVAYGIGGETKTTVTLLGNSVTKTSNSFDEEGINEFDAGLGLGVGAEFGKFLVDLGWDIGLVNLYNNVNQKNQNAYLTIGYKF